MPGGGCSGAIGGPGGPCIAGGVRVITDEPGDPIWLQVPVSKEGSLSPAFSLASKGTRSLAAKKVQYYRFKHFLEAWIMFSVYITYQLTNLQGRTSQA